MTTLPEFLSQNKITQAKFAERAGLHQATISKVCAGKINLTRNTALAIERATGGAVTVQSLFSPSSDAPLSEAT